jgi:short subunit dehydrogenase-like uncharacterized protein
MSNKTSATVFLLVASVFTACAGAPQPEVPDTEIQRKVRTDIEMCADAARGRPYPVTVTPEGNYSYEVIGLEVAKSMVACMRSKGYWAKRVDRQSVGNTESLRSGGEGGLESSR